MSAGNPESLAGTASYIIESLAALPPLPPAASEILTQFSDEFIEGRKVVEVVERDPAICGKLLGLANSAYFNLAEPVTSMEHAVLRVLGVDTVRSLVFAMAVQQSFNSARCPAFDAQQFWLDSLCVAEACMKLARSKDGIDEAVLNLSYPAGLCHNLGLMALIHLEPERCNAVLQSHRNHPRANGLTERLRDEFDTDHRHTTAELARSWSLPDAIVTAYEARQAGPGSDGGDTLAAMLDASVASIGNATGPMEAQVDLGDTANRLGLTAEQLTAITVPGERQMERLRSVASTMKG